LTRASDVTALATTYTANFKLQYQLTTGVFPANAGTVNVLSGTFFDAGSTVSPKFQALRAGTSG
jgi:hypothetical protein